MYKNHDKGFSPRLRCRVRVNRPASKQTVRSIGSLNYSANLPAPDVIAQEIVEDLQAALDEFALIAADLKVKEK